MEKTILPTPRTLLIESKVNSLYETGPRYSFLKIPFLCHNFTQHTTDDNHKRKQKRKKKKFLYKLRVQLRKLKLFDDVIVKKKSHTRDLV